MNGHTLQPSRCVTLRVSCNFYERLSQLVSTLSKKDALLPRDLSLHWRSSAQNLRLRIQPYADAHPR